MKCKRVFWIVLDSFGIGELPDSREYGDEGSNTLRALSGSKNFYIPTLQKLGLFHIDGVSCGYAVPDPMGCFGRAQERSAGKDTITGHWELAGLVSPHPLPTYPQGFPDEVIRKFEELTGRRVICNRPYSGTQVLLDYGQMHEETGDLLVYTSADSVFQVAAHESIVPVKELYRYCEMARELLTGEHRVGRVIARPFIGRYPDYIRTANRHDFSLEPPKPTVLDLLSQKGLSVIGVGKIRDIFAGRGITASYRTKSNLEGVHRLLSLEYQDFQGLCFVNLVDFDMLYGHRNDVDGYAEALSRFDEQLVQIMAGMENTDLLVITADHGCDPSTPSTDHSREYIPILLYSKQIKSGVNLKTRSCFGDVGATIAQALGVSPEGIEGESFWDLVSLEGKA